MVKGRCIYMAGFEVPDPAGATTISHYLASSAGGGNDPTRNTTSPITGAADLLFSKAAGVAAATNYYRYGVITGTHCVSDTFRIKWNTLPATNGNGYAFLGHDLDGTGVGVYRTGGSSYIALWHSNNTLGWNGASALAAGTTYQVTFTYRNGGNETATKHWLGMVILRNSSGTELERSPWVRLPPAATSPLVVTNYAIGMVAASSAWTEAAEYQLDDLVMYTGGVHAPNSAQVYLVRPTADGALANSGYIYSGTALAGGSASSIIVSGDQRISSKVGCYMYYAAGAAPRNQRITANSYSAPNTTFTLAGALGTDPVGSTVTIRGAGVDTDDDGTLWDEVDETTSDEATTQVTHYGTAGNKVMAYIHGGLAGAGGPASLAAGENLVLNVWARGKVTTVGAGTPSWAPFHAESAQSATGNLQTSTSWAWGSGPPANRHPSGTADWTVALINATEIGTRRVLSGNTSTVVDISWVGAEVAHIVEMTDAYDSGATMRETNHLTSDRRMTRTHREVVE